MSNGNHVKALVAKIGANREAARRVYFEKTRRSTKGMSDHALATAMGRVGLGFYSF